MFLGLLHQPPKDQFSKGIHHKGVSEYWTEQDNWMQEEKKLLAFSWQISPNVQISFAVMKAATGSSDKELEAAPPQPHLPFCQEGHVFLFQRKRPTLQSSTSSCTYSTATCKWNQKYSFLKGLQWLSLHTEQYYTRRAPHDPCAESHASIMGTARGSWTEPMLFQMLKNCTWFLGVPRGCAGAYWHLHFEPHSRQSQTDSL